MLHRTRPNRSTSLAGLLLVLGACGGGSGDTTGPTGATPGATDSARIQQARDAPDGATNVAVAAVYVTYMKPLVGGELAGFFLQAEQAGPALFVGIDPASLSPAPVAGDVVGLTIAAMGTANAQRRILALTNWQRLSQGNPLVALVQDVSNAADLVSALGDYESELVTCSGTISGAFALAGTGFEAAVFDTAAVSGNANLRLRVTSAVKMNFNLAQGCSVTAGATPLWRFDAEAQVSAWVDPDILASACPP